MRYRILLAAICMSSANAGEMRVGDGQIDGTRLQPYDLVWRQCSFQDDSWVTGSDLTERMVTVGDTVMRIQQLGEQPDGGSSVSTIYLDRRSMAPVRLEQHVVSADGKALGSTEHTLTDAGYRGRMTKGDQFRDVQGDVNSMQLNGNVLGLALAALDHQDEPLAFAASMIGFDASYTVTATWIGKEDFDHDGRSIESWLIDVHWLHHESGDVYAAGPNASGGRYSVVHNPPAGIPYVLRYQTDSYAIEYLPGICPETG